MPQNLTPMSDFFNTRAGSYDDHMKTHVTDFDNFYQSVAGPVTSTSEKIMILDLGAGTGLELDGIFTKAPSANITCIDLSQGMLSVLLKNHQAKASQIHPVVASYLDYDFGVSRYDYVVSVMSLHHFLPETKEQLYRKIHSALKPGGVFINGDYIVPTLQEEREFMSEFNRIKTQDSAVSDGSHHLDIPLALDTEKEILKLAGFQSSEVVWTKDSGTVLAAR